MISILPDNRSACSTCGACTQVCPVSCITMTHDEEGLSYPSVDEHACIDCGKCDEVCPVVSDKGPEGTSVARPERTSALRTLTQKACKALVGIVSKILPIQLPENAWETVYQLILFSMVGFSSAFVSYSLNILTLHLLAPLHFSRDYMVANITAFLLAVFWSYNWNSRYVFTEKEGGHRSKIKSLLKTYATYAFSGIVLNNILSTVWIYHFGLSKFLAPLLNIPFTVPVNFLLSKLWAYKE